MELRLANPEDPGVVFNVGHLKAEQFAHPKPRRVKQHDSNAVYGRLDRRPRPIPYGIGHRQHAGHLLRRHNNGADVGLLLGHGKRARHEELGFRSRTKEAEPPDNLLCFTPGVWIIVGHRAAPRVVANGVEVFRANLAEVSSEAGEDAGVASVAIS
jgi:hypothetical protein